MEKKEGIHEAMIRVMQEVKNIDKSMTVGAGHNAYSGVADKDVKQAIGQSMANNGLTCVPIEIKPTVRIDRWEEKTNYGLKQKQSVFTEVLATYEITHAETKESIKIMGYGHGQDAMDKSAGKATTYALKNALLYSFLVPTGAIDDTDKTHSNDIQTPQKTQPVKATQPQVSNEQAIEAVVKLNNAENMEELTTVWKEVLTREERLHTDVIAEKNKLKTKLK
tara:strand:+ start:208 stop:873 length:666 start_codon:yes stop_codon:yes gene_type:complete